MRIFGQILLCRYYLLLVGFVALVACSTPDPVVPALMTNNTAVLAQRGREIVNGFGACGACHSLDGNPMSTLAGGRVVRDSFGETAGSNITPANTGIGAWSEEDLKKLFRSNLSVDGRQITPDLHRGFEWLSDSDIAAIFRYLRTLEPVDKEVQHRSISFFERNTIGFFDTRRDVRGFVPAISPQFKVEYGAYLTDSVARCGSCHTSPEGIISSEKYLAGGAPISLGDSSKVAPNITTSKVSGIGAWSDDDLRNYLRSGITPAGKLIDVGLCPVPFYAQAPSDQIDAVVAYLRAVPEVD